MTTNGALAWLAKRGTQRSVLGMARYGIVARRAFGVSVGTVQSLAKRLGKDHTLAAGLWASGWFEARLLAAFVEDPARVTRRQMDAWAAGFENWADCDTVCFHLFDRTPFAWAKSRQGSRSPRELVKRAGFDVNGGSRAPRQGRARPTVLDVAPPHRAGRVRRAQFREERGELGASFHRAAPSGAQHRGPEGGQAFGAVRGCGLPMGGP